MVMLILSACGILIGPTYVYFAYGIKTTITDVLILFTEENSEAEFLGNTLLQTIVAGHGVFRYFANEVAMTIYGDVVQISPKIMELELKRLDKNIEKKRINQIKMRRTIINIIKQALDVEKCVSEDIFVCHDPFKVKSTFLLTVS